MKYFTEKSPSKNINAFKAIYCKANSLCEKHIDLDSSPSPVSLDPLVILKLQKSIALFEEALAVIPLNFHATILLSKCHQRLGQHEVALQHFCDLYAAFPDNNEIAKEIAYCAVQARDLSKGIEAISQALTLSPNDAVLHINYGSLHFLQNNLSQAKSSFSQALLIHSKNETAQKLLCAVNRVMNEAIHCPESYAELNQLLR